MSTKRANGGWIVFSRNGVSFEPPPNRLETGGREQIAEYVDTFLKSSDSFKHLMLFTPDGNRGFSMTSSNNEVQANFSVEWRDTPEKESAIRSFFEAISVKPTEDYLAMNGLVPDSTRLLSYPITGSVAEVTDLTQHILIELCGIQPDEALNISYREK